MLTETQITSKLVAALRKECHAMVLNLHGHAMQGAGWPDIYLVHWMFRGWIEFKGVKTPVQPLQTKIMGELLKRGDKVYVVRFIGPKIYQISTAPAEIDLIANFYGSYKEAAQGIMYEISKYQKLQNSTP